MPAQPRAQTSSFPSLSIAAKPIVPAARRRPRRTDDLRRETFSVGELADDARGVARADVGFAVSVDVRELDRREELRLVPPVRVGPLRPIDRGGKSVPVRERALD